MERVADPTVVAAMFSMVLTLRNKLHVMGHIVPKDPFVDPYTFVKAITSFATPKAHSHVHTLSLPHHFVTSNVSIYSTTSPISQLPQAVFLTRTVVDSIDAAYDKAKQSDTLVGVKACLDGPTP